MRTIELYAFEDANGNQDCFDTTDFIKANEYAIKHGFKLMCYTYEFTDSELVMDYTTKDEDEGSG